VRVQIFEPFSGGHQTEYVAFLLPTLVRLREAGKLERIVLTTTSRHRETAAFAELLAPFASNVDFDVVAAGDIYDSGTTVTEILLDAVKRNRPDYIVSTSADNGALALAVRCLAGSDFRSRRITSVGVLHYGSPRSARGVRNRLTAGAQTFSRRFGPWSELHVVNPLLYDATVRQGRWAEDRVKLLPHPVAVQPGIPKPVARRSLGIPVDGTYLGQIGKSDGRKAIPELLAAFRAAQLPADRRILLAGTQHEPHKRLIDEHYADMLRDGRLIVLDRYLPREELFVATCAMDVISVAYYTDQLSANLLAAVAAGRPVIGERTGYTGTIVDAFAVGYATDIRNPADFAASVTAAFAESPDFQLSEAARRLLHFHDPQHFVDTLLRPLYARLGLAPVGSPSWNWALGRDG
jgi:glycosyltransferase involved in cell wall biosynthesis